MGELLISALGQSMIAKLFPREVRGFIYGAWGMVLALASLAGFSASDSEAGETRSALCSSMAATSMPWLWRP
ncbi:hypothetical protein O0544_21505 [Edwardsiella anguillarum]|nr:hypothetical protein [Edwardsiella anguillarum]